jgi:oligosaccharide translocation protein RFT1
MVSPSRLTLPFYLLVRSLVPTSLLQLILRRESTIDEVGSLIARIVFQPIEETLLLHFSSCPLSPQNGPLISFITHISSYLLLLLPSFLPPLLPPLLSVFLPKKYLLTSAPSTLQTYLCFYIPLLSLNGVLEAYHTATATPRQMTKQTIWMVASSGVFVVALFALKFTLKTETALISASCIAMGVRIVYAYLHAQRQAGVGVRALLPKSAVTVTAVACGAVLRRIYKTGRWTQGWSTWLELLGFGGAMGLVTLGVM